MKSPCWTTVLAILLCAGAAAVFGETAPSAAKATSCTTCHASTDFFDEEQTQVVRDFARDVHAEVGLSCHDCHGGNPDPSLADDPSAMDPDFAGNPYRGKPDPSQVPAFCGRCHSDPALMRRFRPDLRVDQEREYASSVHGKALAAGDHKVATCVACHGTHGILRVTDPLSRVHPKNVAETCRGCHGDAERMAGYKTPDGRDLPIDQYALWRQSVHARALLEKEDLSAPTCNDCHGNHGASPPGVDSVAFVCGQCHGREAQLFRQSPKMAGFERHNDFLATASDGGCSSCHEPPEPQASVTRFHAFSECATCHSNHGVVRPTMAMLTGLPETPCAFCHEGAATKAGQALVPEPSQPNYLRTRDALLASAATEGLSGEKRFDWLVDRALSLPFHTLPAQESGTPPLRPEFERLFTKFRIGKTTFTYQDPKTDQAVIGHVVRCVECHGTEPAFTQEPFGYRTGATLMARMSELTASIARAERTLLRARRGGVETRQALQAIDGAIDAQIELEVLVHTFASDPEGAFAKKHALGQQLAQESLEAGEKALGELSYRRRGLVISLAFIVLVLIGLAWKIRELSRREETEI
ncbi:MAG TPA: hypothetical protein VF017_14370 [Thermoanaerobaculia bacterium]|nr:hypothetical protein [Thermoanaerobaculia bacterium]